jgi:homoserine O-succinyltransferase/O-acetyltransferase
MPLIVEGGRVPPRWALAGNHRSVVSGDTNHAEQVSIALINNMPDAALEDTELQFFSLLDEASGDIPIFLKLYSLTGIPRTDRGQRHLNSFYYGLDELWQNRFDGVIITGTEPRQPDLRDEPYWKFLADVFDWAERNTTSAILSCLAAHASVFHSDGIGRHRLPDKQFGVFDFAKGASHPLTGNAGRVRLPHSRWNEVRADALTACGYTVLAQSAEGGVDTFVKKKRQSLFLHFQGHPEYGAESLLKEYRRDIRRFLKKERETYPTMPKGYFDAAGERLVTGFRETVLAGPREELMEGFPDGMLAQTLRRTWHSSATAIYRNWLRYMVSRKPEMSKFSAVSVVHEEDVQQKRSALP